MKKPTIDQKARIGPIARHLFCDGCGKIHEDTDEFVMCICGRVGCRMEWATPAQMLYSSHVHETDFVNIQPLEQLTP